jgi:hypothetical protein
VLAAAKYWSWRQLDIGGDLKPNTPALFLRRPGSINDVSVVLLSGVESRRACVDIQKEFTHQTRLGGFVRRVKR